MKSRGFTPIEVMMSMVILAGSILVLAQAWSTNSLRLRKSQLMNNVATLLERKMVEVEAQYRSKPIGEIPEEEKGDFGKKYPQYSWRLESQDFTMPDISQALISDNGASDMLLTMVRQTSEFISKSVKEVTVVVIVKTASKSLEYSLTTYFVDYNQSIGLGGGGG